MEVFGEVVGRVDDDEVGDAVGQLVDDRHQVGADQQVADRAVGGEVVGCGQQRQQLRLLFGADSEGSVVWGFVRGHITE